MLFGQASPPVCHFKIQVMKLASYSLVTDLNQIDIAHIVFIYHLVFCLVDRKVFIFSRLTNMG